MPKYPFSQIRIHEPKCNAYAGAVGVGISDLIGELVVGYTEENERESSNKSS